MDYTNVKCIKENIEGHDCRLLLRKEGSDPLIVIGLNPSTADENSPDATMRKIMGFISTWNKSGVPKHDSFIMLNIYPQIEKSPRELNKKSPAMNEIIHNRNIEMISTILDNYPKSNIMLCYGDSIDIIPWMKNCRDEVLKLLTHYPEVSLYSLGGLTIRKNPRHPCRLAFKTELIPFHNPFSISI